jgi:hypothetical protein
MECSLIDHTREHGIAVSQGDRQTVEPICPLIAELTSDPDLIDHAATPTV